MRKYLNDILGASFLLAFVLGWIDWLWIFGVESSQSWTWWSLIKFYGGQ